MINRRIIGNFTILIVFILLFLNSVSALGVSPARTTIDFEAGLEKEVSFRVLNEAGKESRILVYVEDLKDGIEVDIHTPEIQFSEGETEAAASYTVKLPNQIVDPGSHEIKVITRELPPDASDEGTYIGASVSAVHQVRINVPYPGIYATADLLITETGRTDQVDFIVALNSLGKEGINGAKGVIDIYSSINNQKVASIETELFSVDSGKSKEVTAVWAEGVGLGKYYAELNVMYDGNVASSKRDFTIGKTFVEILYIYAKDFSLGEIAKFNILIENQWPDSIKDVYTDFVFSQKGEEVAKFKSATEEISPESKKELTAYWDTEGINAGDYDTRITLYHDDEKIEKNVKTKVSLNSIVFEGLSGAVVGDTTGVNSGFLIGAIVLVVITSIFWVVYFKMKKKK